jgi:AraC-like DNA-binding protein
MTKFKRRTLNGLEIARLDCTDVVFPKHAHDEYVVGANIVGREHIWLDGKELEASVNDVTLYNPGEVQAATAKGGEWSFFSIYLETDFVLNAFQNDKDMCFGRPVVSNGGFSRQIRNLCERSLRHQIDDHEVVEAVTALMASSFRMDSKANQDRPRRVVCAQSKRTSERLMDAMSEPPSLQELAQAEGLTPVQLVRRFTAAYGVPPFCWLNMQRLKRSRQLIAAGVRIADLANDLGFSDQAHFTKRFKSMYSVTPGVWLRSA